MNKEKEMQVEELVENFDMKLADGTNLNKFTEELSNIFGYEFKNESQPTQVDNQWFSFHGYNPKTKKMTLINITQAT